MKRSLLSFTLLLLAALACAVLTLPDIPEKPGGAETTVAATPGKPACLRIETVL